MNAIQVNLCYSEIVVCWHRLTCLLQETQTLNRGNVCSFFLNNFNLRSLAISNIRSFLFMKSDFNEIERKRQQGKVKN
jgi:hypothetical protein